MFDDFALRYLSLRDAVPAGGASLRIADGSDGFVIPIAGGVARVARHTERLGDLVRFYRDGLGLVEVGGFRNHDGYDGAFLAVPGTGTQLEFTAGGGHSAPAPNPESLLVHYLGDKQAVQRIAARLSLRSNPVMPCVL